MNLQGFLQKEIQSGYIPLSQTQFHPFRLLIKFFTIVKTVNMYIVG